MPAAIVLGGGGARAAYQVGALRAIARIHRRRGPLPFPVVCGTSAGAINAVALAINADDFRRGVARLARWWRGVSANDIYRADFASLSRHSAQFLASVLTGTRPPAGVAALLDNAPLAELLALQFDFGRLAHHIESGHLRALSINATSYSTGHSVSFLRGRARPPGVEAHATARRARAPVARAPARVDGDSVPVPRGQHRRRLVHGRLGAPAGAAVGAAESRRATHPRARGRPVQRSAGASRRRDCRVSVVRAGRGPRAVDDLPRQPRRGCRAHDAGQPPARPHPARQPARNAPIQPRSRRCAGARAVARPGRARARVRAIACRAACARSCAHSAARRAPAPT